MGGGKESKKKEATLKEIGWIQREKNRKIIDSEENLKLPYYQTIR